MRFGVTLAGSLILLGGVFVGVTRGVSAAPAGVVTAPAVRAASAVPVPKLAWPAHGEAAFALQPAEGTQGASQGTVYGEGGTAAVPIASLAKMMTAYLTLVEHPLSLGQSGFTYVVTPADVADYRARLAQGQSTLAVVAGERITELELLEGMLVPSGNNAAVILGRYDAGGNLGLFLAEMNASARALGLAHTHYTDPSGLDPGTVSNAADQVRMAEVVMANPVFAHIVGTASVTLPVAGKVHNFDTLVGHDGFVGIKNGADSQAKGCFVFADNRMVDGRRVTIIGVVLGQAGGPSISFTAASLEAGQALADSVAARLARLAPAEPALIGGLK